MGKNKILVMAFFMAILLGLPQVLKISAKETATPKTTDKDVVIRKAEIGEFDRIEASQAIRVVVGQGEASPVASIRTTTELDSQLRVETKDGCLKVYYADKNFTHKNGNDFTVVTVVTPTLKDIEVSSSASVLLSNDFSLQNDLDIEASSSARVSIKNINCPKLDIETSSAAEVEVSSLTGSLDAEASSASTIHVKTLKGKKVDAESSSAATIKLEMISCESVKVEASSASQIALTGVCGQFKKEVSSAARVSHSKLAVRAK